MDFETILKNACQDLKGVMGVSLVGLDGIAISTVILEGEPDLEGMAAELTTFLKTLRNTSTTMNGDDVEQMVIYTPHSATILHSVTSEYFILTMVKKPSLMGKIRFRFLSAALNLREEMV